MKPYESLTPILNADIPKIRPYIIWPITAIPRTSGNIVAALDPIICIITGANINMATGMKATR